MGLSGRSSNLPGVLLILNKFSPLASVWAWLGLTEDPENRRRSRARLNQKLNDLRRQLALSLKFDHA